MPLLSLLVAAASIALPPGRSESEAYNSECEHGWGLGERDKSVATIKRCMADDLIQLNTAGQVLTKAELLRRLAADPGADANGSIDNFAIKWINRDLAVAIGTSTYRAGEMIERYKFLDTWIRSGSSWFMVASHSAYQPAPAAQAKP